MDFVKRTIAISILTASQNLSFWVALSSPIIPLMIAVKETTIKQRKGMLKLNLLVIFLSLTITKGNCQTKTDNERIKLPHSALSNF